jgi:hypothetical protein
LLNPDHQDKEETSEAEEVLGGTMDRDQKVALNVASKGIFLANVLNKAILEALTETIMVIGQKDVLNVGSKVIFLDNVPIQV